MEYENTYRIDHWNPHITDMSGCGFAIKLYPSWKQMVSESGIKQEHINTMIKKCSADWLKNHGYNQEHLEIRVGWGEWGPEHIQVPGNACGLDKHYNGVDAKSTLTLLPHNVDTIKQASLILTVFVFIERALHLGIKF